MHLLVTVSSIVLIITEHGERHKRITATQTRLSNNEENLGNKTLSKNICFRTMCRRRFLWLCVLFFQVKCCTVLSLHVL